MPGVSYGLADFRTGTPVVDLPVMEGASWAAMLNRPDALSCAVDLRDAKRARELDLYSATEPNKTVLYARTDDDFVLAWGVITDDGRSWDEDSKVLSLDVGGILSSWFDECIVAPASALTAPLTVVDAEGYTISNPALDTVLSGMSHGSIGRALVAQRLAWPGSPTVFDLPDFEAGFREQSYDFSAMKRIGAALDDLTKQEGGPDFAFEAYRPNGIGLRYRMRAGTEATPRLGTSVGVWGLGKGSPITELKWSDARAGGVSASWMVAGRSAGSVLLSRMRNTTAITQGYVPRDNVDTSHSDVSVQATLDSYNREHNRDRAKTTHDLSFTVRADASPALGQYRPGDRVTLDIGEDSRWLPRNVEVSITSMSGDETAKSVKIGCVIVDE